MLPSMLPYQHFVYHVHNFFNNKSTTQGNKHTRESKKQHNHGMFQVTKRPKNPPVQTNKAVPGSIKQQHVEIRSHFHSQFSQSLHIHTLTN